MVVLLIAGGCGRGGGSGGVDGPSKTDLLAALNAARAEGVGYEFVDLQSQPQAVAGNPGRVTVQYKATCLLTQDRFTGVPSDKVLTPTGWSEHRWDMLLYQVPQLTVNLGSFGGPKELINALEKRPTLTPSNLLVLRPAAAKGQTVARYGSLKATKQIDRWSISEVRLGATEPPLTGETKEALLLSAAQEGSDATPVTEAEALAAVPQWNDYEALMEKANKTWKALADESDRRGRAGIHF